HCDPLPRVQPGPALSKRSRIARGPGMPAKPPASASHTGTHRQRTAEQMVSPPSPGVCWRPGGRGSLCSSVSPWHRADGAEQATRTLAPTGSGAGSLPERAGNGPNFLAKVSGRTEDRPVSVVHPLDRTGTTSPRHDPRFEADQWIQGSGKRTLAERTAG